MAYTPTQWNTGDTITASAMNKIEQGIADNGAYDAVIRIYHDGNSGHNYEVTILSGSYSAIKEKTINNEPPVVLAHIWDELNNYRGSSTMTSIYIFPTTTYPNNDFAFTVKMPSISNTIHTSWFGVTVYWHPDNRIDI